MPDTDVTQISVQDKLVLVTVLKRTLDASATRELVDDVLAAAAQNAGCVIVLDMKRVKFAPSVALGSLVQLSKSFKLDGRRIALIGMDLRLQEAIRVTQLHKILEIYDHLEEVNSRST
jgi:anti-anti-sigma factor